MKATLKVEDIIFNTRAEAEDALWKLEEYAKTYGSACVSELYELAGLGGSFLATKYMWLPHQLKSCTVLRVGDGYIIDLPPASHDGSTTKVTYRDYYSKKPTPKPEPLTITINTDELTDFEFVLSETFKCIRTISDRPVYISMI